MKEGIWVGYVWEWVATDAAAGHVSCRVVIRPLWTTHIERYSRATAKGVVNSHKGTNYFTQRQKGTNHLIWWGGREVGIVGVLVKPFFFLHKLKLYLFPVWCKLSQLYCFILYKMGSSPPPSPPKKHLGSNWSPPPPQKKISQTETQIFVKLSTYFLQSHQLVLKFVYAPSMSHLYNKRLAC